MRAARFRLRFLNFYPSQVKQLAPGGRVRCFGEMRAGFFGAEMIHPRYRIVAAGTPLPSGLTPVYPDDRRRVAGCLASRGR